MTYPIPKLPFETVLGADFSAWQAKVDWLKVAAANFKFAFIKATEHTGYKSPEFTRQWLGAKEAGLLRGAYHFWAPDMGPAKQQAEFFVRVMGPLGPGDLPPVLDVEWVAKERMPKLPKGEALIAWIRAWCERVEELTGRWPVIYTGPQFWKEFLLAAGLECAQVLSSWPLWCAAYAASLPDAPMKSMPDWKWTFWQFTGSGQVPGVSGHCDVNLFRGSLDDLRKLAMLG